MPDRSARGLVVVFSATLLELSGHFMLAPWLTFMLAGRGIATDRIGAFASLAWLGVLCITPWAGRLAHALGMRAAFWWSGALPLFAALTFVLTNNLIAWTLAYALMGLASGLRWVVAESLVAQEAPPAHRGRIMGAFATMIGLTFVIGPALLGLVGPYGHRAWFIAWSLMAVGLLTALLLPTPTHSDANEPVPGWRTLWQALRASPGIMAAGALGGMFESGLAGLLPLYGLSIGWSAAMAAWLVAMSGLGSTVLMIPAGELADRLGHGRILRACAAAIALGTLLLPWAPNLPLLPWLIAWIWGGAGGALYTVAMIDIGSRTRGSELVTTTAVLVMAYTAGGALSPALGGLLLDRSPDWGFPAAFAGIALAGLAAIVWTQRQRDDSHTHHGSP